MTPVRLVVFQAPIPIPSTQRREPLFDADDGWTIECHGDGVFRIAGHGADFFTDGFVSWVPMPSQAPVDAKAPLVDSMNRAIREVWTEDALEKAGVVAKRKKR